MFELSTEICLRSVALLIAGRDDERPVNTTDIGAVLGLSAAYVTKSLQPLARRGYLRSIKGRGGGWELAVRPESVSLYDVVRTLEPNRGWARCVIGHRLCSDETPCPFHDAWKRTLEDFEAQMKRLSLADLSSYLPPQIAPQRAQQRTGKPVRTTKATARKTSAKRRVRR